jgi:hypothetical protein
MTMRLAIVGGREFSDYALLEERVLAFVEKHGIDDPANLVVLSGRARGADQLGERFASDYAVKVEFFIPNWDKFGKRAGFIRNELMADASTHVLAFWDGASRGTYHMINYSQSKGKLVEVVRYEG